MFYSFPQIQLDNDIEDRIYDIMTQQKEEEFFTHSFEKLKLLNYYFQIYSDWARGKKEMVLVSIMINKQISPEIEESISSLCRKFTEKMQSNKEIFTGFYINELRNYEEDNKERIKFNEPLIKELINDLYWDTIEETRKKSEEEKITVLLNDRYVFESLEKMSGELKIISREVSNDEGRLKENPEIRNSITKLNNIIEDLYEGFIEKMTNLDIEEGSDLLSTDDDLDDETQKSKKALLEVLVGEINGDEK